MRTERNRVKQFNDLRQGEQVNIPKDIHSKASAGFKNWQQARIDAGKPVTTELPSIWRKKK